MKFDLRISRAYFIGLISEILMVTMDQRGNAKIQSKFNGSNTFWTMRMRSRQGQFEPLGVYYRARSGGKIEISC